MVARAFTVVPLLLALAGLQAPSGVHGALSIPDDSSDYDDSPRAQSIAETASQIENTLRWLTVNGEEYAFYYGPVAEPGSLTEKIRLEELKAFKAFATDRPAYLAKLVETNDDNLTSLDAIKSLYEQAEEKIELPMSLDNSDETFGEQRVTIKAFGLSKAQQDDLNGIPLALDDDDLREICGFCQSELLESEALFVEDFFGAAEFNDPRRPDKYVPDVVGFFCANNETGKLLPVEIRLMDTGLAYTPRDTEDEWTLAKMALEVASNSFHQMYHGAEIHAVTIPLRVAAYRSMSEDHPVRALLLRHVFMDFALDMQVPILLLNVSTGLDMTYGWGATGFLRALDVYVNLGISMKDSAFAEDLTARGLDAIPNHKYAYYGNLYATAIDEFVGSFLDVYYEEDSDVAADVELQNWATESHEIPYIKAFPETFGNKDTLRELLTHLIFTSTVRHHAINGAATWHASAAPYSPTALWSPLPENKLGDNESLDLLEYTVPDKMLPEAMSVASAIFRDVPKSESMYSAYKAKPFSDEAALKPAIRAFDKALQAIEKEMLANEADETWPFLVLLPSRLPHYTWV